MQQANLKNQGGDMFGLTLNDIVEILEQASVHNQHTDHFHEYIKQRKINDTPASDVPDTPLLTKQSTKIVSNH